MTERAPSFLQTPKLPAGMRRHIVVVRPATSFEYRFGSSGRRDRVLQMERGALEPIGSKPAEVLSFRAGISSAEMPTRGGFFTSPDSITMAAEAQILVEGGTSGDVFICRSLGSFDGLKVAISVSRERDAGGFELVLNEEVQDADEHSFTLA